MTRRSIPHPRIRVVIRNGRIQRMQTRAGAIWKRVALALIVVAAAGGLFFHERLGHLAASLWPLNERAQGLDTFRLDRDRVISPRVTIDDVAALLEPPPGQALALGDEQALIYAARAVALRVDAGSLVRATEMRTPPAIDAELPDKAAHGAVGRDDSRDDSPRAVRPEPEPSVTPVPDAQATADAAAGAEVDASSETEVRPDLAVGSETETVLPDTLESAAQSDAVSRDGHSAQPRTVTVESGDSLWSIARRVYGDASKAQAIFEANRDTLATPAALSLGQVLRLPEIDE
ncbi:MAG: LysM peptidoglycan-binding domain-containing protein [Thiotrichales bacterium]